VSLFSNYWDLAFSAALVNPQSILRKFQWFHQIGKKTISALVYRKHFSLLHYFFYIFSVFTIVLYMEFSSLPLEYWKNRLLTLSKLIFLEFPFRHAFLLYFNWSLFHWSIIILSPFLLFMPRPHSLTAMSPPLTDIHIKSLLLYIYEQNRID
jgi:hypothetical protein